MGSVSQVGVPSEVEVWSSALADVGSVPRPSVVEVGSWALEVGLAGVGWSAEG